MATLSGETGAESLGMATGASGGTVPRRVNLEFPPPPSYPPPQNIHSIQDNQNLNPCSSLSESFSNLSMMPTLPSSSRLRPFQDYSYAYYEPSTSGISNPYPVDHSQHRIYQESQYQPNPYLLRQMDPAKRHTYVTRYGTEENIYEEISDLG